jgi:hypothetical protein
MNTDPSKTSPPYTAMPPVAPPDYAPGPYRSESGGWHKPIGIISIVLGVCGFVGGCVSALWPLLSPYFEEFARNVTPPGRTTGMEGFAEFTGAVLATGLLAMAAGGLLVFAGIGTAKKRPWGPRLSVTWAIVKMIVVVLTLWLGWPMQKASMDSMQKNLGAAPLGSGFYETAMYLGVVFGLLWGWAYPVFLLIWMSRAKVRAQVRDTWT